MNKGHLLLDNTITKLKSMLSNLESSDFDAREDHKRNIKTLEGFIKTLEQLNRLGNDKE